MWNLVREAFAQRPWLTSIELLVAALMVLELVFLAHVVAGWLVGVVTHNDDAMQNVRFVFMTGQDGQFFAGFVGALAVLPACLLLLVFAGIAWVHATSAGLPTAPYVQAAAGAGISLVALVVLVFLGPNVFGGGILPH